MHAEAVEPNWEVLCGVSELAPHAGVAVQWRQQQLALFYVPELRNAVYVVSNCDPITRAEVMAGGTVGVVDGELVVTSPLYDQHYSLRTGRCLGREGVELSHYAALLAGDKVWIRPH